SCLDVAEQANLKWNPFVENVLSEVSQLHYFSVFRNRNVINKTRPVSDAMCSTVLNRLPDRFFPKALACVNRDVEILPLNIVKSVYMLLGRIATLFACQIEPNYSPPTEVDGKFGHFERHIHIAHRADN